MDQLSGTRIDKSYVTSQLIAPRIRMVRKPNSIGLLEGEVRNELSDSNDQCAGSQ